MELPEVITKKRKYAIKKIILLVRDTSIELGELLTNNPETFDEKEEIHSGTMLDIGVHCASAIFTSVLFSIPPEKRTGLLAHLFSLIEETINRKIKEIDANDKHH